MKQSKKEAKLKKRLRGYEYALKETQTGRKTEFHKPGSMSGRKPPW